MYAIYSGRQKGVFYTWEECKKHTIGFKGAIFKKFSNLQDAERFAKYGTTTTSKILVYTDGACSRNGTNSAVAGIGIYFSKDDPRNISRRIIGKQTNNIAELTAILEVSHILKKEIENGCNIEICTDSKYSLLCLSTYGDKQHKLNWTKDIPNRELVKDVYNTYKKYPNVTFRYVPAHTNRDDPDSIGNYEADKLATSALL